MSDALDAAVEEAWAEYRIAYLHFQSHGGTYTSAKVISAERTLEAAIAARATAGMQARIDAVESQLAALREAGRKVVRELDKQNYDPKAFGQDKLAALLDARTEDRK